MLSVSALKLYRTLIKTNTKYSIKEEVVRHTLLCLMLAIPLLIASFIEAYISSTFIGYM